MHPLVLNPLFADFSLLLLLTSVSTSAKLFLFALFFELGEMDEPTASSACFPFSRGWLSSSSAVKQAMLLSGQELGIEN